MGRSNTKSIKRGVSIIIPCYNSSRIIAKTLSYLQKQNVSSDIPWEIVIVDNGSTDRTADCARAAWPLFSKVPFKVVSETTPGLSHARSKGFDTAEYDFISFIDDDNFVFPDWVQIAYETMINNESIGACGGYSVPMFEIAPPAWFDKSLWTAFTIGPPNCEQGDVTTTRGHLWGAGSIIRKSAWQILVQLGFRYQLVGRCGTRLTSGEDIELFYALRMAGWRLWQEPRLKFYHYMNRERIDWQYLLRVHNGFGASAPVLYMYRHFLESTSSVPIDSWRTMFIKTLKKYLSLYIVLHKTLLADYDCKPLLLRLATEKGKLTQLWFLRQEFYDILRYVQRLHHRLEAYKTGRSLQSELPLPDNQCFNT
jgi:glycosyltransferase involved in cell wall biosynthesis